MNNETKNKESSNFVAGIFFIFMTFIFVVGIVLGHFLPHASDDITYTPKEVYYVATTTISISQEEKDCKKQGGDFSITPLHNYPDDPAPWDTPPTGYRFDCILHTPDKVLSSHTISVGN